MLPRFAGCCLSLRLFNPGGVWCSGDWGTPFGSWPLQEITFKLKITFKLTLRFIAGEGKPVAK
jgi:hypothetical protein